MMNTQTSLPFIIGNTPPRIENQALVANSDHACGQP